ncbi:MAG: Lrp/AsnC ligand binding domain-containing protein [Flavobacteriaceae bacterium]|nr:Lrp/AsnC ligand binding domain-containing protein [Flavobacteriaceae bacterium]
MKKKIKIDATDNVILSFLMDDARTPILKIAREVGISGAAVHQRLRKLEVSGLIDGSKLIINAKALGYKSLAYVGIHMTDSGKYKDVISSLKAIPEVVESHYTTGNYSIFIKIMCRDNEHLMSVLNDKIQKVKWISKTETFLSLDQEINRQIELPLI